MLSMYDGELELGGWSRHFLGGGVVHGDVQDMICMRRMMNVLINPITLQLSHMHAPKSHQAGLSFVIGSHVDPALGGQHPVDVPKRVPTAYPGQNREQRGWSGMTCEYVEFS